MEVNQFRVKVDFLEDIESFEAYFIYIPALNMGFYPYLLKRKFFSGTCDSHDDTMMTFEIVLSSLNVTL